MIIPICLAFSHWKKIWFVVSNSQPQTPHPTWLLSCSIPLWWNFLLPQLLVKINLCRHSIWYMVDQYFKFKKVLGSSLDSFLRVYIFLLHPSNNNSFSYPCCTSGRFDIIVVHVIISIIYFVPLIINNFFCFV